MNIAITQGFGQSLQMANSTVLALRFFLCLPLLYLIMESELDLERVKGESPLLELFLAQMMSVMCCATRVMATVSKGGWFSHGEAGKGQRKRP